MADRQEMEITIGENGEVRITVKGVNGPRCLELTKELEEELGLVLAREKTSEYYKEDTNTQTDIKSKL